MGDIPERGIFRMQVLKGALAGYFELAQGELRAEWIVGLFFWGGRSY